MADLNENLQIAAEIEAQAIDRMAGVTFPLLNEPQAYKRSCLRAGYRMAMAIATAREVEPNKL
jgi:ABC-type branched-subunit amino acid transport system ATPase component